jgi:uncharacterized caspase-like protein
MGETGDLSRRGFMALSMAWPFAAESAAPVVCQALLIGNGKYQRNASLPNTAHDTRLIANALQSAGVQVEQRFDLTQTELDRSLRRFCEQVSRQPGSAAWISFAGHGVQIDGKNYLQGIDSDFSTPSQVRGYGCDLDELLLRLAQARPAAAVVTLDACRNNPFKPEPTRGAAAAGGWAPAEAAGVLIGFSTAPYMRAADGKADTNSPYARALADALAKRPAILEDVFRQAGDQVYRSTGRVQVPEYRSSLRTRWRFGMQGVELQPLEASTAADPTLTSGAPRSSAYRPDATAFARAGFSDLTPADWAEEWRRLETRAARSDAREARQLVKRGDGPGASPADATIAGLLRQEGRGIERDRLAAIASYERAAVRGHAVAQTLLGELLYERGDYPAAYKWLSAAADAGLPRAALDLAQMKFEGRGGRQDAAGAAQLLQQVLKPVAPSAQAESQARDLVRALMGGAPTSGR